jgi:hypothetical protein
MHLVMLRRRNRPAGLWRCAGSLADVRLRRIPWLPRTRNKIIYPVSLTEIKSAVRELSPTELTELANFILEEDNAAWTKQMDEDAAASKLDFLFDEADKERAAGKLRDWPEEK